MRKFVRDKFRAHMVRRRAVGWKPAAIAAVCALYFGGGLAIGFLLSPGWPLAVWTALGPLTVALIGYNHDAEAA